MFVAGLTGQPAMDQLSLAAVRRAQDALRIAAMPARPQVSLVALLRQAESGSFGKKISPEYNEHRRLCEIAGDPPPSPRIVARISGEMLRDTTRDMTAAGVSGSNYLASTGSLDYLPSLTGDSAALRLGVQVIPVPRDASGIVGPRGSAGATAYWLDGEGTQITESQPSMGQLAATSKTVAAFTQISRQLLLTGANAEGALREELRRAAAAALDAAIFNGSGASGEPLGVVGTPGIGAFTGTSLAAAALRNAQADLGTAKAITNPERVAYVTPPEVAELLASRQRFTGSSNTTWEGSSFDGLVEGVRAVSTIAMPTATMLLGDWSSVAVLEWSGGLIVEFDPFSSFNTGLIGVRMLLDVDVIVTRPAAFTLATSIT